MASDLASAIPGGSSQGCRQHELSAALDGFWENGNIKYSRFIDIPKSVRICLLYSYTDECGVLFLRL